MTPRRLDVARSPSAARRRPRRRAGRRRARTPSATTWRGRGLRRGRGAAFVRVLVQVVGRQRDDAGAASTIATRTAIPSRGAPSSGPRALGDASPHGRLSRERRGLASSAAPRLRRRAGTLGSRATRRRSLVSWKASSACELVGSVRRGYVDGSRRRTPRSRWPRARWRPAGSTAAACVVDGSLGRRSSFAGGFEERGRSSLGSTMGGRSRPHGRPGPGAGERSLISRMTASSSEDGRAVVVVPSMTPVAAAGEDGGAATVPGAKPSIPAWRWARASALGPRVR